MSFSISAAGHIVAEDAAQIEKDLVADLRNLFSLARYAPHIHAATATTSEGIVALHPASEPAAESVSPEAAPQVEGDASSDQAPQVAEPVAPVSDVHEEAPAAPTAADVAANAGLDTPPAPPVA